MKTSARRTDPKTVLHNLCREMEIPATDEPSKNLTRVRLTTRTKIVDTAIQFDSDKNGFEHSTALGRVNREDAPDFAELAIRNPPRELTPVLSSNGLAGVQGAKSPLPSSKTGLESVFLDVFGRVTYYTDNDFPQIMNELDKKKRHRTK